MPLILDFQIPVPRNPSSGDRIRSRTVKSAMGELTKREGLARSWWSGVHRGSIQNPDRVPATPPRGEAQGPPAPRPALKAGAPRDTAGSNVGLPGVPRARQPRPRIARRRWRTAGAGPLRAASGMASLVSSQHHYTGKTATDGKRKWDETKMRLKDLLQGLGRGDVLPPHHWRCDVGESFGLIQAQLRDRQAVHGVDRVRRNHLAATLAFGPLVVRRVSSALRHPASEFTDFLPLSFGRVEPAY